MPFLIVHGHFYQPPRENPWTGMVEAEPSAAPFHDWNERIHFECYRPNAYVRVGETGDDEQFRHRYLTHISTTLDQVELFGVDVRHYRPNTPLTVAYISLAVSVDSHRRSDCGQVQAQLLRRGVHRHF